MDSGAGLGALRLPPLSRLGAVRFRPTASYVHAGPVATTPQYYAESRPAVLWRVLRPVFRTLGTYLVHDLVAGLVDPRSGRPLAIFTPPCGRDGKLVFQNTR